MASRMAFMAGAALLALGLLLAPAHAGGRAFVANADPGNSCPEVQMVGGLWVGSFMSDTSSFPLPVALMITQDETNNGKLKRQFMFEAETANGMVAMGDGVIAASGETHIMGMGHDAAGMSFMVKAHGEVMGCDATMAHFMYDVMFADGTHDMGMVMLVHCETLPAGGFSCPDGD